MQGTVNDQKDLVQRYKKVDGKDVWCGQLPKDYVEKKEPEEVTKIKNDYWYK